MEVSRLIDRLERFADTLPASVAAAVTSPEDARWRPPDGGWSVVEIVSHLVDEENEDFRARVRSTLADPTTPWSPLDPEAAAVERRYDENNLDEMVQTFVAQRRESVAWLRTLSDPDWSATYRHPKLRSVRAGDVFASWVAHDALHLRQIAKRMYQMTQRDAGEYSTDYAGSWTS